MSGSRITPKRNSRGVSFPTVGFGGGCLSAASYVSPWAPPASLAAESKPPLTILIWIDCRPVPPLLPLKEVPPYLPGVAWRATDSWGFEWK